jgi:hypothetical protein
MLGRPDAALNDKSVGPDCIDIVSGVNTLPKAKMTMTRYTETENRLGAMRFRCENSRMRDRRPKNSRVKRRELPVHGPMVRIRVLILDHFRIKERASLCQDSVKGRRRFEESRVVTSFA